MLLKHVWRSPTLETLGAGELLQLLLVRHNIGSPTLSGTKTGTELTVLGEDLWGCRTHSMISQQGEHYVLLLSVEIFVIIVLWNWRLSSSRLPCYVFCIWSTRFWHNWWTLWEDNEIDKKGAYVFVKLCHRYSKGVILAQSLNFYVPIFWGILFVSNIGLWGVQSVAAECLAHSALF